MTPQHLDLKKDIPSPSLSQEQVPLLPPKKKKSSSLSFKRTFITLIIVMLSIFVLYVYTIFNYGPQHPPVTYSTKRPSPLHIVQDYPLVPIQKISINEPLLTKLAIESNEKSSEETPMSIQKEFPSSFKEASNSIVFASLTLYQKILQGKPFQQEWQKLNALDNQSPFALLVHQELRTFMTSGILTIDELLALYEQRMPHLIYSFYDKKGNAGWIKDLRLFIKTQLQFRPSHFDDTVQGFEIVYKPQDEIKAGHIQQALHTISFLPPQQIMLLDEFIAQAQAHVKVESLIETIEYSQGEK